MNSRLAVFARLHANLRLDLRVDQDPVDFARHNIDLRICYGANLYPEMTNLPLCYDEVLPLCAPSYFERNPAAKLLGMQAVSHDDLIHTNWGPMFLSHPTWKAWFAKAGLGKLDDAKGYQIGTSGLVLDMARDGVGVALGQRMMATDDLAEGRLVALSEVTMALGEPYCFVYPMSKARKPGLQDLIDWLSPENEKKNRAEVWGKRRLIARSCWLKDSACQVRERAGSPANNIVEKYIQISPAVLDVAAYLRRACTRVTPLPKEICQSARRPLRLPELGFQA